ncbi:hypothetical protein HNQ07_000920 [Deinococcus metalli]|uniref:Uncharacterized protein n=1 Tax=Deinococcus metalli TaxID=1141878 RepID=A0A7W8KCA1_9DEIO|nr:hypothetical protein [Deinococcus metalli]MBB5375476.1 hypothetical protein [Deinococcus metalli]GHF28995.1 hypothetical protein GCM10017781_01200 [Deinococcus metalli]
MTAVRRNLNADLAIVSSYQNAVAQALNAAVATAVTGSLVECLHVAEMAGREAARERMVLAGHSPTEIDMTLYLYVGR